MASIASSSSTSTLTASRPQAGPLPSKQGEIGYREDLHGRGRDLESGVATNGDGVPVRSVTPLPARHPADRDVPPAIDDSATTDVPLTPVPGATAASGSSEPPTAGSSSSSLHSTSKRLFRVRKVPTYGGLRATTLAILTIQCLCIMGTIAGWALAIMSIAKHQNSNTSDGSQQTGGISGFSSTNIFIHVIFAIVFIAQLLFLERRIFTLRAERYSYLHPGEVLPTSNHRVSASMGYAPWHRPPLPTYAAALAQSGHGTGDVEDNAIAVPPPPAYGNTRDSRLLLQGFLRNSLRAQRPVSEHSQRSERDGERPLSYASRDQQWQEIQDVERAIKLEETLGKLEEGSAHVRPTTSSSTSAVHSGPANLGTDSSPTLPGGPDRTSGSSLSSFWQRVARG